jgi:hypothetical protein
MGWERGEGQEGTADSRLYIEVLVRPNEGSRAIPCDGMMQLQIA